MSPPLVRASVSEQVFRHLVERVVRGEFPAGERLPTQRALAAELGVNMASVREAVKRLESLRLVETRHGDAMRVRDWRQVGSLDVLAHALVDSGGALDRTMLGQVFEARTTLLSRSGQLAAERRDDEQAGRLTDLAAQLQAADDVDVRQALDYAFFATLVEASRNIVFALVMNSIRELYFAHRLAFRSMLGDDTLPDYVEVAEAVAAQDAATATAAVERLAARQQELLGAGA